MMQYWAVERGEIYASRKIELWTKEKPGNWKILATASPKVTYTETILSFPPVKTHKLKLRQPARSGSRTRPQLMWLREIEVY